MLEMYHTLLDVDVIDMLELFATGVTVKYVSKLDDLYTGKSLGVASAVYLNAIKNPA